MNFRICQILPVCCAGVVLQLSVGHASLPSHSAAVRLLRVPNGGLQPQAVMDERGTLHLIYFKGEPGGGNIYYVRRNSGRTDFTTPIRINSELDTAVATGTIRGAQMAIGRNGRVHVAWNGPHKPDGLGAPMFYTRTNDGKTGFEPQRNVMQFSGGLDGGGSVAADNGGNVYVAWHGRGDREGEENRRVWLARSSDDGRSFSREAPAWSEPTGACGCCGMRAFADREGGVHLLYRAARNRVDRDMYILSSDNHGRTFTAALVDKWKLDTCPMSSAALSANANGLLAAWETQGQVYFASFDPQRPQVSPIPAPGTPGKRKHPVFATNSRGAMLFVWTEGTGWKRGGSLSWQLYDSKNQPLAQKGEAPGIPAWSFVAVVVEKDDSFTVIY